jgi:DNA end-binding protein Ku
MAESLIDSMAGDFQPDAYTDNYREALQEVIDAKVEGREIVAPPEEEGAAPAAVDLMAALRASVERARAARGEEGTAEPTPITSARSAKKATPAKKTPAKKAEPAKKPAKSASATKKTTKSAEPAKKAAAKKTTAKKTPAKKAAARKSA